MKSIICCALLAVAFSAAPNLKVNFDAVDSNKDGSVSEAEFLALVRSFDVDQSGSVTPQEFVPRYSQATGFSQDASMYVFLLMDDDESGAVSNQEAKNTYKTIDLDNNGMVTFKEFSTVMTQILGDLTRAKQLQTKSDMRFNKADTDKDGKLSPAEMAAVFASGDKDMDSSVSLEEFKKFWDDNAAVTLFGYMDADHDGKFSGQAEKEGVFKSFDRNQDGIIDKSEYDLNLLALFARSNRAKTNDNVVG